MGAGGAVVSLMSPVAPMPEVSADAPGEAAPTPEPGAGEGAPRSGGDADLVEIAPRAPGVGPAPDDLAPLADADTAPAARPQVGEATEGLDQPQAPDAAADMTILREVPIAPAGPSEAPAAPGRDELSISTDPAQPPAPDLTSEMPGMTAPAPGEEAAPQLEVGTDAPPVQPRTATEETAPEAAADPSPATEPAATPEATDTADAPQAPAEHPGPDTPDSGVPPVQAEAPQAAGQPEGEAAPRADTESAPERDGTDARIAALPQAGAENETDGPTIGTRVIPLTERDAATPAADTPAGPPPLEAHAAPFDNPEDKPLMAIVLIDDGDALGVEALHQASFPITFAVDPALPDASARMARHRAAGFEVAALLDLPLQASPQDAEVALVAGLDTLSETVALLEGPGTGIQGNRGLSDQVIAIANATGRGLVTQDSGLNTVAKLARNAGVPADTVFRDFDGAGQTATIMRRFLDQAAFRARQEGAVIMLGRVRPETITALQLWALQDRAASVALAPLSAVLTRPAEEG